MSFVVVGAWLAGHVKVAADALADSWKCDGSAAVIAQCIEQCDGRWSVSGRRLVNVLGELVQDERLPRHHVSRLGVGGVHAAAPFHRNPR
jgi:hypothetical protein